MMNPIKRYPTARTTLQPNTAGASRATLTTRATLALAVAVLAMASMPSPAAAYIGPGAALSLLGAFWGLLVAVGAAVAFAVAWPIRRMLRMRRERSRLERGVSPERGQESRAPQGSAG